RETPSPRLSPVFAHANDDRAFRGAARRCAIALFAGTRCRDRESRGSSRRTRRRLGARAGAEAILPAVSAESTGPAEGTESPPRADRDVPRQSAERYTRRTSK